MEITPFQRQVRANELPLEKLAANGNVSEKEKISEVSRQFEAVLLRQILSSAQKTHFKSKYADTSTAGDVYRDMVTNQFAEGISKSGALGFGKVLATQMSHGTTRKNLPHGIDDPPALGAQGASKPHPVPSKGAHHPDRRVTKQ